MVTSISQLEMHNEFLKHKTNRVKTQTFREQPAFGARSRFSTDISQLLP